MRITREEYLMESARLAAKRSTCNRLQVGAILERDGRIIASGYNGAPRGFPHCDPQVCRIDKPCTRTVHAEANCIYFAARHGIATVGSTLWTTDSPCAICAQAIINAGIIRVVYEDEYRDISPVQILQQAAIQVIRYATQP
jgi:dCMP deaminase